MDQVEVEDVKEEYHTRSLHDYWYPVALAKDLTPKYAYSISLFGIPLVLFRGKNNSVVCLEDRCSHRSTPLSIGAVENGNIECRYHGWRFGEEGVCTRVPSFEPDQKIPDNFAVPHYPAREKEGMLWVWLGDKNKIDNLFLLPTKEQTEGLEMVEQYWDSNYSADVMMENALDPAHLQFVHVGQQGKNIGPREGTYPGAAGTYTKVERIPGGFKGRIFDNKTVRHTDFQIYLYYPYYTVATVDDGSTRIRICSWIIPLSKNRSRLLFRFYRSFVKFLPAAAFTSTNNLIARQDVVVLTGQQMRVEEGASNWNIKVKADSLSYEYTKWWKQIEKEQKIWFRNWESTQSKPSISLVTVTDIEDIGRSQLHPCVDRHVSVQEEYATKVAKEFSTLWPDQYGTRSKFRTYALIATSIIAVACGYWTRGYLQ